MHGDPAAAATPQGLADRRDLALVAVERTRMPMVVSDARQPDNPIVLANQAFLDLTGYSGEEVLGRNCRFLQGEHTSPATIAELRAAVSEGREASVELLNYRKDGSRFWNQLHLSPIFDDEGRLLYFFASQIDMTELRKVQGLEAAEHRLLREVDHRALNVLAIVEGIVRLSRADDSAAYAAAVQQRVQALARAHALMAGRGWQDAPLDEVVHQQLDPYGGRRARLEGGDLTVPVALVQPLALVLHELMVNAVTHGALSVAQGELLVRWRQEPGGELTLDWEETGGPAPPAVRRAGFGLTMTAAIVRRQLQGAISYVWRPEGLKATIRIPAAA